MDVIEATRGLGKALQADPCFSRMQEVSRKCDADKELQEMIGHFNLIRMNLNNENQKDSHDQEKVDKYKGEMQETYTKIMGNPNMILYTAAQKEMDSLLKRVYGIISKCAEGEDPATADYTPSCTHDCSSCGGGCH
ncbi:MAG TPA: YlbF family regulator [Ruminococcaceae bacterium]|jgi:cell fate (sporulation/competence/biofilm development) regulator YlbF (YheA/YmcA/DUF963 family)|nr:YlbF family regulator [Oscillospiraceae bacterium]HCA71932.1 YlbF family regulator [Oscillospiraceae bacterium]HCC03069.1 YlbF family regulator [Oscillospiraceae bacterium]HCM24810.1 YlbF family regulator [Oscillospiraceae bacterium]